jgi:hypothetical protein
MPAVRVSVSPAHREFKPVILATGRMFTVTVAVAVVEQAPAVATTLYTVWPIGGKTVIEGVVSAVLHK